MRRRSAWMLGLWARSSCRQRAISSWQISSLCTNRLTTCRQRSRKVNTGKHIKFNFRWAKIHIRSSIANLQKDWIGYQSERNMDTRQCDVGNWDLSIFKGGWQIHLFIVDYHWIVSFCIPKHPWMSWQNQKNSMRNFHSNRSLHYFKG